MNSEFKIEPGFAAPLGPVAAAASPPSEGDGVAKPKRKYTRRTKQFVELGAFAIEHGIPLPPPKLIYPFKDMKPGDSFLVPGKSLKDKEGRNRYTRAQNAIHGFRKTNKGAKFQSAKWYSPEPENKFLGWRIWRMA